MKILLQRGTYDIIKDWVIRNECRVAIPSEYFIKKPSKNDKISYTLVSLIMRDGDSFYCGHYFSDVFDINTEIWWHCDDANITEIGGFPEGVYTKDSHKQTNKQKKVNLCQALNTYCLWFIS